MNDLARQLATTRPDDPESLEALARVLDRAGYGPNTPASILAAALARRVEPPTREGWPDDIDEWREVAEPNAADPVLCYVCRHDHAAWFTTRALGEQWGDDWNDVPYDCNAGDPYGPSGLSLRLPRPGEVPRPGNKWVRMTDWRRDGTPGWRLVRLIWCGPLILPHERWGNSCRLSVQGINAGDSPWLLPAEGADHGIRIQAGTPLTDFVRLVRVAGGAVALAGGEP